MLNFADRLIDAVRTKQAPVAVELDPRLRLLPPRLAASKLAEEYLSPHEVGDLLESYCVGLIRRLAPLVPAIVLPVATFDRFGNAGRDAFFGAAMTARKLGLLVIADGRQPAANALAGSQPMGQSNLLRHVWDVDAICAAADGNGESLLSLLRVASETGKGLFIDPDSATRHTPLGTIPEVAGRLIGQGGYSSLGLACTSGETDALSRHRQLMPDSLFLLRGSAMAEPGAALGATDAHGQGVLLTASRDLTCCYLRDPWRQRFAPTEWDHAVHAATADWIARVHTALPTEAPLLA